MKTNHAARPRARRRTFQGRLDPLEPRTLLNATIDVDGNGRLTFQTDPAAVSTLRVSESYDVYTFAVGAADAPIVVNSTGGLTVTGAGTRSVTVARPWQIEIDAKADSDSILVASTKAPTTIRLQAGDVTVTVGDRNDPRGLDATSTNITVTGSSQYANNRLIADDRGASPRSWPFWVDSNYLAVRGAGMAFGASNGGINYSGISSATMYAAALSNNDTSKIQVQGTPDGVDTRIDLSAADNNQNIEVVSTSADPTSRLSILGGPSQYTQLKIDASSSPVSYQAYQGSSAPHGNPFSDVRIAVAGMTAGSDVSIARGSIGEVAVSLDAAGLPVSPANFQADGGGNVVFTAPAPRAGTVTFSGGRQTVDVDSAGVPPVTFNTNAQTATDYILRSDSFGPGTTISDYSSALIDWGDGTSSAGAVVPVPGDPTEFNITGSHAYAQAGTYHTVVRFVEYTPIGYFEEWTGQGATIEAPAPAPVVVASFTPPPGTSGYDFSPLILWGDNSATAGVVKLDPTDPTRFNVTGSHVYGQAGTYTPGVLLRAYLPDQDFTVGGQPIKIAYPPAAFFNGNSFVIQGALDPDYVKPGGPPVYVGSFPYPPPPPAHKTLLIGSVNAASPRIEVYATPEGGGSPILFGQGSADAMGSWKFTPPADATLPDGVYTLQVQAFNDLWHQATALTTVATGYVVGSPPPVDHPLVIDGLMNPKYGPYPPPPPEPLPPGVTRSPTALFSGSLNVKAYDDQSIRIEVYATPSGGGSRLLFGRGAVNEDYTRGSFWYFAPVGPTSALPDGVYTIQVQAFDDADHVASAATTIATGFVVDSNPSPLHVQSRTLTATAGAALTDVVVATFTPPGGASAGDFIPLILWGDGGWSEGRVVVDPSDPTRFDVLGSHVYARSGSYTPGVIVQPAGGADWTANGYSENALAVAGGFGDARVQSRGATNDTEPLLVGRTDAAPGAARIVAYATTEAGASILIGQGVSGPSGYWTIRPDVPLPDGRYSIQIQAIDDARRIGSAVTTIATGLVVDTVGPRIVGVRLLPGQGRAVVSLRDSGGAGNAGTGVDFGSATSTSSYLFTRLQAGPLRSGVAAGPLPISRVVGSPPFRTAPQRVSVVIDGGRPIRRGAYRFTVLAIQGVRDRAGNPLQGGFDGRFPTRGAGDFNARFNVVGGRASRPRPILAHAPRAGAMRS